MATILLVDDDQGIHQTYSKLLPMVGHSVMASAFNGFNAINTYTRLNPKPDLVLMDQRMPRMDGITATQKLKHLDPECLIIFLSADNKVKREALAAGAAAFKTKPLRLKDLLSALRKILKLKKSN
ncbi:MAG: response regulator transcription factor [Promethearchaeota archaeon]